MLVTSRSTTHHKRSQPTLKQMTETQEQLIRSIEQQLENLAHFKDELAYEYESKLYYSDFMDEPIVEKFTPELLKELEDLVYQLDN
jgi:phenylacetate-coenzyme A ligase PaaK-like adenylate-forming protein